MATPKHVIKLPPGNYHCEVTHRLIVREDGRMLESTVRPIVDGYYGGLTYYQEMLKTKKEGS